MLPIQTNNFLYRLTVASQNYSMYVCLYVVWNSYR